MSAKKAPSINVTLTEPDPSGARLLEALADGLGMSLADVLERFAEQRAAASLPVTAAELDKLAGDVLARVRSRCALALGQRKSRGVAMIQSATVSRDQAAANRAAGSVTNINLAVPELVEYETDAKFDQAGRMVGTVTKKARVR